MITDAYGTILSRYRGERKLTLRETSGLAFISPSYLHEVEKGKKEPSSTTLTALLRALDIHLADFYTEVAVYLREQDGTGHRLDGDVEVRTVAIG